MGLFNVAYQVGIEETVKNEPMKPVPKQTPIDKRSCGILIGITISIVYKGCNELFQATFRDEYNHTTWMVGKLFIHKRSL